MILQGLSELKDFKSIIYKMNTVNKRSIEMLRPIFEKRLPNHLEELKIIDCKIHASMIKQLMTTILERSQLRAFSLVNVHHSPESFDLVIQYLEQSETLKELDLSWNIVKPTSWLKFFNLVSENRQLVCLTLAFNKILEEQSYKLTLEERMQGVNEVFLTEHNAQVMENFKNFVKYNPHLIHLDLQQTGLMSPAIKALGHLLTRA